MTVEEISSLIGNLGFPIVMSMYFLMCGAKILKENTQLIKENTKAIIKVDESLERVTRIIEKGG